MTEKNQRGPDGQEIALEARETDAGKLYSPSAARNKQIILDAFTAYMPNKGLILEVGSGTGEHGAHIAAGLPDIEWQPSDPDPRSRESITAWGEDIPDGRMRLPLDLNVITHGWWEDEGIGVIDGLVSINMIHISPFTATEGLFRGANALLTPGERLFFYGPFSRGGEMVDSNRQFNEDLKRRDPEWGVRDLDKEIRPLAANYTFHMADLEDVPANNMVVVFERG